MEEQEAHARTCEGVHADVHTTLGDVEAKPLGELRTINGTASWVIRLQRSIAL
jgi:hypothetical protein